MDEDYARPKGIDMSELRTGLTDEAPCFPLESPTNHRTWQNHYATYCGLCGRILYVDQDTLQRINYVAQTGPDNPMRCESCGVEYDDLAFEG